MSEWQAELDKYDREVEAEAARLLRDGVSPRDAMARAHEHVQWKRQFAAKDRLAKAYGTIPPPSRGSAA